MQRVEDRVAVAAQVRRGTHPVEHERIGRPPVTRVEAVIRGVDSHVRHAAPVELLEQGPEPVRVLVVDRDRALGGRAHGEVAFLNNQSLPALASATASRTARSTAARSSAAGVPSANCSLVAYTPCATTVAPMLANSGRSP